jgi:DNA-directed RNA polymerase beta subunit
MNQEQITEDQQFDIIEKYFTERGPVFHQFESYEYMVNTALQKMFDECPSVKYETATSTYKATFGQIYIEKASVLNDNVSTNLYPNEARERNITYSSSISIDVTEEFWEYDEKTEKIEKIKHDEQRKVFLMKIPTMVKSSKCNLYGLSEDECVQKGECPSDHGGYFIINGIERVLICQERMNHNQTYVFPNTDDKYPYVAEIRSMSEETGHSVQIQVKISEDLKNTVISLPYMAKDVKAGAVFKAIGFNSIDIYKFINPSTPEEKVLTERLVRESIMYTNRMKAIKYISTACQKIEDDEARMIVYTQQVIDNELFPHMGLCSDVEKGLLLGDMINKLFRTAITEKATENRQKVENPRPFDDRDNVSLKRIEGPCLLIVDLLRMSFKRFCDELKKYSEGRRDIVTAIKRKNAMLTTSLQSCYAKGDWSIQKNSYCFTGDTLVSLSNGMSKKIKDLLVNEKVISYNEKTNKLENDEQYNFIDQGIKPVIKLTFQDGRTIKCTPDHKFMVIKDDDTIPTWVEAKDIPCDAKCLFGPSYPEDIRDNDEIDWKLESKWIGGNKIWTLDSEERHKTLALVRMIGFITSDGNVSKTQNSSYACLGNLYDLECFQNDHELLIGEKAKYYSQTSSVMGHQFLVNMRAQFTKYISIFITRGNKTQQPIKLPDFILDPCCPKAILREFLGGLFGGDGGVPHLDSRSRGYRSNFSGVSFSWAVVEKYLPSLKMVFEQLQVLLQHFNISSTINGPYYEKDNSPRYRLITESTTKFAEYIGFRYCIHKTYKLSIATCYWRMEEKIKQQFSYTLNRTEELYKKGNLANALETAQNELKDNEYVFNEHYSLLTLDMVQDRRRKTDKYKNKFDLKTLKNKFGVIDAKTMLEEMNSLQWFRGEYVVNNVNDKNIPYYTLKMVDKRTCGEENVFCISVKNNENFLANSCVVKNCRTGVSQVMSRLTYPATLSHLRRVVIPIAKDGKNVKIRQIHPTQMFFVDLIESPEGKNIGIIKNLALLSNITTGCNAVLVREIVDKCKNILPCTGYLSDEELAIVGKVYVNGVLVGLTKSLEGLYEELEEFKLTKVFSEQVSFTYDIDDRELRVFCDAGRYIRPVLTVGEGNKLFYNATECAQMSWKELVENDIIRYVDSNEIENSLIAMYPSDLAKNPNNTYQYCEIHPSTMLGICSAVIPYPEHSQCIFKDEPVFLSDGTTKPICDIKVGDKVITFDPETQKHTVAFVSHTQMNKTDKKIYQLTTLSNRKIIATFDHKFMTSDGWKPLEDVDENSRIAISLEPINVSRYVEDYLILDTNIFREKMLKIGISNSMINKYTKDLENILPLHSTSYKTIILARLVGFCLTDCWIGLSDLGCLRLNANFGHKYSSELFNYDLVQLGFKELFSVYSDRKFGKVWVLSCNGALPALLLALGCMYGRKTAQEYPVIQNWIMNGSDMVKREFLAGFQGGDGSKIKIPNSNGQLQIHIGPTSKTVVSIYEDSLKNMMSQIVSLFLHFGIKVPEVVSIDSKYYNNNSNENMKQVSYSISCERENLIKYFDVVGYRYDIHKLSKSGNIVEYMKYIDNIHTERKNIVKNIQELYTTKISPTNISQILNLDIKFVRNILKLKGKKIGLPPKGYLSFDEWNQLVSIKNSTLFVPIKSKNISHENIVCDITIDSPNQSFLSGDRFCVHNCPRLIYQSSMLKQALGVYSLAYKNRFDNLAHVMHYPQKPLIETRYNKMFKYDEMLTGANPIVAVMPYGGLTMVEPVKVMLKT